MTVNVRKKHGRPREAPISETHAYERRLSTRSRASLRVFALVAVLGAALAEWGELSGRRALDTAGLAIALLVSWPIWRETLGALRSRRVSMELTMAVGGLAAIAVGERSSAALIFAFTLLSMVLEDATRRRGERALKDLLRRAPDEANLLHGDEWTRVPAATLRPGDWILVRPGEKVPADGVVVAGVGEVTEAPVSGEPFPRAKEPGDPVFAGSLNGAAALEVRVRRGGEDTTLARVGRLVEEASQRRGEPGRIADRLARFILFGSLAAALVALVATWDFRVALSVVLVAGACGVALGTPLALMAVTGRAARFGVIVKGGDALDALARADTFVFDKTGTLTLGRPVVERVVPMSGWTAEDVLANARAVEEGSAHPVAEAIRHAAPRLLEPEEVHEREGRGATGRVAGRRVLLGNLSLLAEEGVEVPPAAQEIKRDSDARGHLAVFVAVDGRLAGALLLHDAERPDARSAIRAFRGAGARVLMVTGDQAGPAREVARRLDVTEHRAELLPEDKSRIVEELTAAGRVVCFVGDGINDAPALAAADVGVAVSSGSDLAIETADVVLMGGDLERLVETRRLARQARRVILTNFVGTLALDAVGIALAWRGMLGPAGAAAVHIASEWLFILNAARLLLPLATPAALRRRASVARPAPAH